MESQKTNDIKKVLDFLNSNTFLIILIIFLALMLIINQFNIINMNNNLVDYLSSNTCHLETKTIFMG